MMRYERKEKEQLPVLAICYDFDKTLTPDDMQAQGYIQSVGYDVDRFWEETNILAHEQEIGGLLKAEAVFVDAAPDQILYADAPIEQAALHGLLFAVLNVIALYAAHLGETGHHAGAVPVAQTPADLILLVQGGTDPAVCIQLAAQIVDIFVCLRGEKSAHSCSAPFLDLRGGRTHVYTASLYRILYMSKANKSNGQARK